jgi:cysteinyl-tRNA synthetase
MRWKSPWGEGYPGWHIECSAMAMDALGETIDIHTGGEDLTFPHHECEIAQSSGATGKPFARYWLHARYLLVDGEKMSKSRGNFYTVRDLLARNVDPAVLRYELLRTHYRSNLNFTIKGLEDSDKAVRRLREFAGPRGEAGHLNRAHPVAEAFSAALADDLNISGALGEVFKWIHATPNPTPDDRAALWRIDSVLGVLEEAPAAVAAPPADGPSDEQVETRCRQIDEARARKDFARSDALRDELTAAGIEVQITREGVKWRRKMRVDA